MNIYTDTSALIAWFHPADEFAQAVTDWCRERSPEFSWNLHLRIELRHQLRRLSGKYAAPTWHAYRGNEPSRKLRLEIHRLSGPI
jgi:predicted nucleic acid-binding protein